MPLWRVITAAETTCTLLFEMTEFFARRPWPLKAIRSHLDTPPEERMPLTRWNTNRRAGSDREIEHTVPLN